jgi:translation initiation factor 5
VTLNDILTKSYFNICLSFVSDPTKFFGCELGAQTQFDHKNDRYIVNGSHDAVKLQDLLFNFIDKWVL